MLVAVVGGSGSGKTWLAKRIAKAFPRQSVRLGLDDFYRDRSHLTAAVRAKCNFDDPKAIDWDAFEQALRNLAEGKSFRIPGYDFTTHCRRAKHKTVHPKPVVIVDGLWVLRRLATRPLFGLKIFLECPAATRLKRRLERDTLTRGRTPVSIRRQFRDTVDPMHQKFVAPQRRFADLVLGEEKPAFTKRVVVQRIRALMEAKKANSSRNPA